MSDPKWNTKLQLDLLYIYISSILVRYICKNNNTKLERNCDFSSNNHVWDKFYDFFVAILNFDC